MHHHHALALLLFSIVFAAFALFTLCTFAPKAHHASLVNNNPGDAQINALAGLPIRRRSEDDGNDSQLFVRDGILVNYRGYGSTMKPDEDINHTLSISSMEEASSVEKVKAQLYRQCAQHLRFFDSSLPLETTVAGLGNDGILSKLITAGTLLKRDHQSLPNACIEFYQHLEKPNEEATTEQDNLDCDQDEEGRRVGVYFEEMPVKREVDPSLEKKPVIKDKDQQPTGEKENVILTKELSTPEEKTGSINNVILTEEKKQGAEQPKKKHSEVTVDTHRTGQRYNPGGQAHPAKTHNAYQEPHNPYKAPFEKRDAQNVDLLGAPLQKQKKKVIIDFKKAQRDAQLADLADGFLIETEYLTPGRKVVQHLSAKPGTRVSFIYTRLSSHCILT
jgi:hypothetical protein